MFSQVVYGFWGSIVIATLMIDSNSKGTEIGISRNTFLTDIFKGTQQIEIPALLWSYDKQKRMKMLICLFIGVLLSSCPRIFRV